jgi:hypothetical protein
MSDNPTVVSASKTGSSTLALAFLNAGFPVVPHVHFLGQRRLDEALQRLVSAGRGLSDSPMLELALQLSDRAKDPTCCFRIVTGVRDPIARAISHAFHTWESAKNNGVDFIDGQKHASIWLIDNFFQRAPLTWFDDHIDATFGLNYLEHPFDHHRGSLRVATGRLKWLVLRVEDGLEGKEADLAWLSGRTGIKLPRVNVAAEKAYAEPYLRFCKAFIAPQDLRDKIYESPMVRHFYSDAEREAFSDRWSGKRSPRP